MLAPALPRRFRRRLCPFISEQMGAECRFGRSARPYMQIMNLNDGPVRSHSCSDACRGQ